MARWARYLTPAPEHRRLGLVCLGTGEQSGAVPACRRRVLDCYAAVLLTAGRGRLEWGEAPTSRELVAPALFWLVPGVSHAYGPDAAGWTESWVLFEGAAARAYEGLDHISRSRPVVRLSDPAPVRRAFARLVDACRQDPPDIDVEAAALTHQLVVAAHRARESPTGDVTDEAVLAGLRDDAYQPMSVVAHAARLGVSAARLREVVRRGAGCLPNEYLIRVRLSRAKTLLAESELTVGAIAARVGYDDPAYFARLFTRRVGVAPRTFRQQQRR
ncbi:MAG: AraC family transcriptional regulator [Streptosporangiales bacterium]